MGDSLQDQLKALGLARDRPQRRQSQSTSSRARPRGAADGHRGSGHPDLPLDRAYELRARDERRRSEKTQRLQRDMERERRLINQAIRAIVDEQRLNQADAEIGRNFLYKGRIRRIFVTTEQQAGLNSGAMGIAYLAGGYHLLSAAAFESVRAISADHVVELREQADDEEEYPVPDDLTW